jgi:hypothetical protein
MTTIQVDLDDDLARQLEQRSAEAGLSPAQLARQLLTECLERSPGPLESFLGIGASSELRGDNVDELLENGFGR